MQLNIYIFPLHQVSFGLFLLLMSLYGTAVQPSRPPLEFGIMCRLAEGEFHSISKSFFFPIAIWLQCILKLMTISLDKSLLLSLQSFYALLRLVPVTVHTTTTGTGRHSLVSYHLYFCSHEHIMPFQAFCCLPSLSCKRKVWVSCMICTVYALVETLEIQLKM